MRTRVTPRWQPIARRLACVLSLLVFVALLTIALPRQVDWQQQHDQLPKRPSPPPPPPTEDDTSTSWIDYLELYERCSTPAARVFAFLALILWLIFLFAFVGITASDFFSPNLATLSSRLGLSEAVAGSTLLAFGNGSPDVFSTFAALRSNSGLLAVGELLGAAAFIVSFVAGSMCLVGDFKVAKHTFLRDVAFFTAAIILFAAILWDGKITQLEAGGLVGFYVIYVLTVTLSSWWHTRQMRREEWMRKVRGEYAVDEPYRDDPTTPPANLTPARSHLSTRSASPVPSDDGSLIDEDEIRNLADSDAGLIVRRIGGRARSNSSAHRAMARTAIRPSLLSAVEFRDVVNSLRNDSADQRMLGVFRGEGHRRAVSAYLPRNTLRRTASGRSMQSPRPGSEARVAYFEGGQADDAFAEEFGQAWREGDARSATTSKSAVDTLIDLNNGERNPWADTTPERPDIKLAIPNGLHAGPLLDSPMPVSGTPAGPPAILIHRSSSPQSAAPSVSSAQGTGRRRSHFLHTLAVLFPALQDMRSKSILGILVGVLSTPAILVLTLTLPVVDEEIESAASSEMDEKDDEEVDEEARQNRHRDEHIAHRLHAHDTPPSGAFDPDLVDAGLAHLQDHTPRPSRSRSRSLPSPPASPIAGVPPTPLLDPKAEAACRARIQHALVVVQCFIAPIFCLVSTVGDDVRWWHFLIAAGVGAALGGLAYLIEAAGKGRLTLCFVGFAVAVLWIMTIVNEVVGVLQAIGHIFGLSDAIIGLTIFAVGNSLGDLVANLTIARMGYPVMAIAACYGGPMLNILLGVGISGSYFIASTGHPYYIKRSPTLVTTAVALLAILIATLICVPMNGFVMTKRWGLGLMGAYLVLLTSNVILEITLEAGHQS